MTTTPTIHWAYTSAVEGDRVAKLRAWTTFDEIIVRVAALEIRPLYWEPAAAPHLNGCHRASFDLPIDPDLYDGFFNAEIGYRGQFAASEGRGETANRDLVKALTPRLLEVATMRTDVPEKLVIASLAGKQAKVWIVESEVEEALTDPSPAIDFPYWEFNAPNGQGLRAPRGTMLEVKGSWVNPDGSEVCNPFKCRRSSNIHLTGDSK